MLRSPFSPVDRSRLLTASFGPGPNTSLPLINLDSDAGFEICVIANGFDPLPAAEMTLVFTGYHLS